MGRPPAAFQKPYSSRMAAMPSSSLVPVTRSAASCASGAALPMATPVPACRSMEISLVPSPKARVSSGFIPRRSAEMPEHVLLWRWQHLLLY